MPQKHKINKTHKAVIINTVHFSEILCLPCRQTGFSDLVAKKLFGVGSNLNNESEAC
jgi:hypothetical protein